ncbi:MAG: ATP-binding protein [Candidatus Micrarchaeota archaeon]|nr:ATP-binding protein [Candidatus Micrarchaeota archaeon]
MKRRGLLALDNSRVIAERITRTSGPTEFYFKKIKDGEGVAPDLLLQPLPSSIQDHPVQIEKNDVVEVNLNFIRPVHVPKEKVSEYVEQLNRALKKFYEAYPDRAEQLFGGLEITAIAHKEILDVNFVGEFLSHQVGLGHYPTIEVKKGLYLVEEALKIFVAAYNVKAFLQGIVKGDKEVYYQEPWIYTLEPVKRSTTSSSTFFDNLFSHSSQQSMLAEEFLKKMVEADKLRGPEMVGGLFRVRKKVDQLAKDYAEYGSLVKDVVAGNNPYIASRAQKSFVLLHGPPGTGKTILAESFAKRVAEHGEKKVYYLKVDSSDVKSVWHGHSEKSIMAIKEAIDKKRKEDPDAVFVILFDEADQLFPNRAHSLWGLDSNLTSLLLQLMSGDSKTTLGENVVIFFTTNNLEKLDPALLDRSEAILVDYPTLPELQDIVEVMLRNLLKASTQPLYNITEEELKELAKNTTLKLKPTPNDKVSGRDVERLIYEYLPRVIAREIKGKEDPKIDKEKMEELIKQAYREIKGISS